MKVGIDLTPLKTGHRLRGIGFYVKRLVKALQSHYPDNEYFFFTKGHKLPKVDLIHYPYFELFNLSLPIIKHCPLVVTIFDLIPLIFWQEIRPGIRGTVKFQIQKFLLKKVDRIITISQASKKDIAHYLAFPAEKIDVIYLAADDVFRPIENREELAKIRAKYNLPKTFLLYVGDVNYNKNLPNLLRAVAKLDLNLVMVGEAIKNERIAETRQLLKLAQELGILDKLLRVGFVPDTELVAIYNLAFCYVQPSLYEGFGLPVLEAAACGVPLAISKTSSLSEVGGRAAVYFDPESSEQIAAAVGRIYHFYLHDPGEYNNLKQRSLRQAANFSWQNTAAQTLRAYQEVLKR